MDWTPEQKLDALLRLPWTIRVERDDDDGYFVARVNEIPSAIATASNERDLERELWESLRLSLDVYLRFSDPIPLPARAGSLPWERKTPATRIRTVRAVLRRGEIWDTHTAETAVAGGAPIELPAKDE